MATLTETAKIIRKSFKFIITAFVLIFILSLGIGIGIINTDKEPQRQPKPTPSVLFGTLPPISFPESNVYPSEFKLETISGRSPVGTDSAKVYFVPKKAPTFFSRKHAVEFAKQLGFNEPQQLLNEITYKFTNSETGDTLVIDIANNNYFLKRNIDISHLPPPGITEEESQLISRASSYFSSRGAWDSSLIPLNVSYFIINNNNKLVESSKSAAQAVRIDYAPPSIGGVRIITPTLTTSNVYIIFIPSGSAQGRPFKSEVKLSVIEASYQYIPADITLTSTYPTISGDSAWEQLVSGNGYIATPPTRGNEAVVRDGYFAYLLTDEYQPYLQPVYVFTGDNKFTGIVPAIDPSWVSK